MRFTRRETAKLAGVSEDTLSRHVRAGHLPPPRRGNLKRKWYSLEEAMAIKAFFTRPFVVAGERTSK